MPRLSSVWALHTEMIACACMKTCHELQHRHDGRANGQITILKSNFGLSQTKLVALKDNVVER